MIRPGRHGAAVVGGSALLSWLALAFLFMTGTPANLLHRILFFLLLFAGTATSVALLIHGLSFRAFHYRRNQGDLPFSLYQGVVAAATLEIGLGLYLAGYLTLPSGLLLTAASGALQAAAWPRPTKERR